MINCCDFSSFFFYNDVQAITGKGGRYLETQIQGSKVQAEEGMLVLLAAGDRTLFDDCKSCFQAMGKSSFFLGKYHFSYYYIHIYIYTYYLMNAKSV